MGRLIAFLIFGFGVYLAWGEALPLLLTAVLFTIIFVNLVRRQSNIGEKLKLEKAFLDNCTQELEILRGNWRERPDGREYIHRDHPYGVDLNVYGPHSLFQYLNRTKTELASERLAGWLGSGLTDVGEIHREQNIIAELARHPQFLLRFISHAQYTVANSGLFEAIRSWSNVDSKTANPFIRLLTCLIIPAYAILSTFLFVFDVFSFNNYLLTLILPGAFIGFKLAYHQKLFNEVLKILSQVDQFESMVKMIREQSFESVELRNLVEKVNLAQSETGIAGLRRIVGAIESRNNVMVALVLNLLIMWDFQCARRLAKWKRRYGAELYSWLELANTFESYASFSIYVFVHPDFNYARFTNSEEIQMRNARHVLMTNDAVPNSCTFDSEQRFTIVTGANMAGKSTYLRMVGTTMILAMRGLPVPVEEFSYKPRKLYTSMLSADSLGENESYFFNELRRLRLMTDKLENGESLFVILDEILKGTNSKDKAEGSQRFIEKLLHLPVKGIIATHDLSLCDLGRQFPGRVKNMKFEVGFKDNDLDFQYKLEEGVCENMNASFLLKKMGLTQ